MINEAEQKISNIDKVLQSQVPILKINIPQQTQNEVVGIIAKSNKLAQDLKKKSAFLFQKEEHYDPQLQEKLNPFKVVNSDRYKVWTWQIEQIQAWSLYPIIANIVLSHTRNFLDIETQIDPYSKNLLKMPKQNKTVMEFVNDLMDKTLLQQFSAINLQFESQFNNTKKKQLWEPILQHCYDKLSEVNFLVDPISFRAALWNKDAIVPVGEDQIVRKNSQTINQLVTNNFNTNAQDFQNQTKKLFLNQVEAKRKISKKKPVRFFSIVTQPTNFQTLVNKSLQKQASKLVESQMKLKKSMMPVKIQVT